METNTVVLNLNDYNQLREFKEKMEEGNTYKLPQPYVYGNGQYFMGQSYPSTTYITTDEVVTELLEKNKQLSAINDGLANDRNRLKFENDSINSKFAKMSIWEFMRWKKAQ